MPAAEVVDHLTTYTEATELVLTSPPEKMLQVVKSLDPYPKAEIVAALTRSYLVSQATWAASDAVNAEIIGGVFPDALFTLPFLQDKLKYYFYFRASVKISIRITTTKFNFGALLIAWQPFYDPNIFGPDADRMKNLFRASQNNPIIISAQQGSTVEFEIPWVHPNQWALIDTPFADIGAFRGFVLHPLSSSSSTGVVTADIAIYAQLQNVEIAGYAPDAAPIPRFGRQAVLKKINAGVTAHSQSVRSKKSREAPIQKEAEAKAESGVISGAIEAVSSIAPLIGAVAPEFEPVGLAVSTIGSALSPIFKWFGLNKPTTAAVIQHFVQGEGRHLALTRGLEPADKLALNPDTAISTAPGLCGFEDPQPTITGICMQPTLVGIGSFDSTNFPGDALFLRNAGPLGVIADTIGGADAWVCSYPEYYSLFAKYWRGSMRFQIRFVTSSFITCRIRIVHLLEALTSSIADISGDLVSKVVEINGDTSVSFTIPWLSNQYYGPTFPPWLRGTYDNNGAIAVYLETVPTGPDPAVPAVIYWSLWEAAGPDFRLHYPVDIQDLVDPGETFNPVPALVKKKARVTPVTKGVESQCDMRAEFRKDFPGLINVQMMPEAGIITGESMLDLLTLCHRFAAKIPQPAGSGNSRINYLPLWPDPGAPPDQISLLIHPFRFMRGGVHMFDNQENFVSASLDPKSQGNVSVSNGITLYGTSVSQGRFEVPYYDARAFQPTLPGIDNFRDDIIAFHFRRGAGGALLYALGDDFSLGCLTSVPYAFFSIPADQVKPVLNVRKVFGREYQKVWPK